MKKILGISAYYHDSAACITLDDNIIAAASEERFTRKKHTADFPAEAVKFCLEESGFSIDELDAVVFYDKPMLKFERLLETYYSFSPRGLIQFIKSIPVWISQKLFLKKRIVDELQDVQNFDKKNLKLLFSTHHLSHAAGAYFRSAFNDSAILTIDGVGEWATATISKGNGNKIKIIKEMNFPHSVGLLYSAFTYFLGFRVNSGEYKLMGLAPYGNPHSNQTKEFINRIKKNIVTIKDDGSIFLNQKYFNYATGLTMINDKKWKKLFCIDRLEPDQEVEQVHCNLAFAIQNVTEEIIINMATEAKRLTKSDYLCMSGGVALNCVANGKLLKKKIFKDIFIQPASGDAGGAVGAALSVNYMYFKAKREVNLKEKIKSIYLGPYYSRKEVLNSLNKYKGVYKVFESFDELSKKTANLISNGNIVGWFQDRMEFGPRALGNRSILADPRNEKMQKKLNLKIKYREGFRPFAPSVLFENVSDYFDIESPSPYMLLIADVNDKIKKPLPKNYYDLDLYDRLYHIRSEIPSVTHLDFSARIQTVHKSINPKYWNLINDFRKITNYALLINTSFNVRGEPIVCSPEDAFRCFMSTDMDYLVINNFMLNKKEQIDWENKEKWKIDFKKD